MSDPNFQWQKDNDWEKDEPQPSDRFDFEDFLQNGQWVSEGEVSPSAAPQEEPPQPDPIERLVAPPRPEILVAEPRPRVVVTPEIAEEDEMDEPPRESRRGGGGLWALVAIVVIGLMAVALWMKMRGREETTVPAVTPEYTVATMQPVQTYEWETDAPEPEPEVTTYTITVTAGSGGSVSPNGLVTVAEGSDAVFAVIPDEGYEISQLLVDGEQYAPGSVTLTDIRADHSVYAVFTPIVNETPEPTPEPTPESTPEPTPEPEPEPTTPPDTETQTDPAPASQEG